MDAKRLSMSRLGHIMQRASSHIMKKFFPLIHSRLNSGAWAVVMLVVIEALSAFLSGTNSPCGTSPSRSPGQQHSMIDHLSIDQHGQALARIGII